MSDLKSMFARISNGGGGDAGPSDQAASAPKKASSKQFSIEKTYQKKSQLEHILLRPDTYIGSVEKTKELMWVYDTAKESMVQKEITFVPGLYKIFDEILVNAADNKQRDKKMDCIKIDINPETNTISIWNNGGGIPVVMHKDEKMYVPTMIFGHLLTSSNYNDEEEKVTGGRNGYGAKLCNIFSTKFTVETGSKQYKKSFKQTWVNNMTKASEPKIKEGNSDDFTKVTFSPDLAKFKMDKLDDDIVSLMSRRAYDCAASSSGVKVFLNGTKLGVKNFKDYIDLYIKNKEDDMGGTLKVVYEHVNERWEVALTLSDRGFQQVSFVNSIATTKGGRHVDHVVDAVVKQLIEVLKKKNKGGIQIKPFQVKNHMWIFVNCLIVNPTFDSQTKENMTLQAKSFGSKCPLSEKFITGVAKSGIVESVLSWAKFKAQNDLAKTSGKKQTKLKGIPKLEDANDAGTKNAHLCTLILTEGDSAKTLAVSGLSVVGRDHYGVFPLRGKLLNVREATHKQILENVEINALIKIMGLQYKKKYTSVDDIKTLRYGKIMIMTDQDQDGSHIKGLLINFIHHNWPELLRLPFLEEFITPIVKATKKNHPDLSFYSLPEFEEWKNDTDNHHTYNIKYYKGLGTSTAKEAKEYFSDMARHRIKFKYDGSTDDHNITMAFAKKCVDLRKEWLTNHMEETKRRKEVGLAEKYLYTKDTKAVSYSDFVNRELVLFSNADNVRSIPNIIDGFKPGQRKVLFTCIKRNDKREVKVAQLGGSVAEHSAYHHGEVSLHMTIVNLAQNYVGSNNINLLQPRGQFGTRLSGGKDSASPRYIFTLMSPLTRLIFHPHDDALLTHEYDDNQKIEPVYYLPIIPMVLVNGADGIGTGWMTKIPNFNPRDLVTNLRRLISGEEAKPMQPWYKNFKGKIQYLGEHRYAVCGEVSIIGTDLIEITELPVGTWTQTYKENILEPLLHGSEKVKPVITDYKEYNTDTTVRFVVTLVSGQLSNLEKSNELHKTFKLISSISLSTMNGFDENNCLRRYDSAMYILQEFYKLRLKFYGKRKEYLEGILEAEAKRLTNQARFIVEKCDKDLVIENKKRKAMIEELVKRGYDPDPVKQWKKDNSVQQDEEEAAEAEDDEAADTQAESKPSKAKVDPEKAFNRLTDVKKYGYLLGMSMWMLTKEKKDELLKQRDDKMTELNILRGKKPHDLWLEDLEVFSAKLDEVEEKERQDELSIVVKRSGKGGGDKGKGKKKLDISIKSGTGRLVEPIINDDMMKKYALADRLKESRDVKFKKVKEEMNLAGSSVDNPEVKDEFDILAETKKKPLKERLASNARKDGLKQSSITDFSNKEPRGKKKSSDSSSPKKGRKKKNVSSDDEDIDFDSDVSSLDGKVRNVTPGRAVTKRAATKPVRYNLDSDDSDAIIFKPTNMAEDKSEIVSDSDFEDSPPPALPNANDSDMLFDSLMGESSKEKETAASTPAPAKPKPAPRGKKKLLGNDANTPPKSRGVKRPAKSKLADSSDEDDAPIKNKKPPAKRTKKANDSDSDVNFIDESPVKEKTVPSRVKKPVSYAMEDSDDSD